MQKKKQKSHKSEFKIPPYGSTFIIKFKQSNHMSNGIEVRHLPILTRIQINAWNIAKAAIIITQICKKFEVMKPSMWITLHTVQFMTTSLLQATVYVNSRRAERDLKNNTESRDLTAVSLEIPVSGVKHNVFCFHSICRTASPKYEIQQGHCFMLPLLTLLAEATITWRLVTALLKPRAHPTAGRNISFS